MALVAKAERLQQHGGLQQNRQQNLPEKWIRPYNEDHPFLLLGETITEKANPSVETMAIELPIGKLN